MLNGLLLFFFVCAIISEKLNVVTQIVATNSQWFLRKRIQCHQWIHTIRGHLIGISEYIFYFAFVLTTFFQSCFDFASLTYPLRSRFMHTRRERERKREERERISSVRYACKQKSSVYNSKRATNMSAVELAHHNYSFIHFIYLNYLFSVKSVPIWFIQIYENVWIEFLYVYRSPAATILNLICMELNGFLFETLTHIHSVCIDLPSV